MFNVPDSNHKFNTAPLGILVLLSNSAIKTCSPEAFRVTMKVRPLFMALNAKVFLQIACLLQGCSWPGVWGPEPPASVRWIQVIGANLMSF